MSPLTLAHPQALLLLVLIPVLVALARGRSAGRGALLLRGFALGALILALASPQVRALRGGQSVIFAVDRSESISTQSRRDAIAFVREAARYRHRGDRVGVLTFGADAVLEEAPAEDPRLAFTSQPNGSVTDLAQAIRTSLAALPLFGARRIVLATDGNANRGDLDQALALASSQGVPVSVVPLSAGEGDDVLVEEVAAPAEVRTGEQFAVRVPVVATAPAQVTVRIREDDRFIATRTLAVQPGRTIVTLQRVATRPGLVRYAAVITASPDAVLENDRADALVIVRGAPTVWYVAPTPGVVGRLLAAQGMSLRTLAPEALPASLAEYRGVSAVVLDDVPATHLAPAQMTALRDYVGHLGGGLVAIGGPHSFGVGGYAGTPLEEALPVSMDVRHRLAIPSIAIILVLDTSGSMGTFGAQIAKVELAKETAQSVVDLLGERDLIGVISFDQEPRWLAPLTEARHRDQVMQQVSRVQAGGGTNMYPALRLAENSLARVEAKIRHVIVISDGQTDPGDFQGLVSRMAEEKITVSSVAVGADADEQIMRNVARWGGGRYYLTRDLYSIPQILTAEALLASRAYVVEERFVPERIGAGLVDDFRLPALRGYIATTAKPAATVHLTSPSEDPLLATWQYGIGRAVAFTSDAGPRWTVEWMSWSDLARFFSRIVRWTAREDSDGLTVTVEQVDATGQRAPGAGTAVITLDAYTPAGDPVDGLKARADVVAPDGNATVVALVQSAPGRYEGRVAAERTGPYAVSVTATTPSGTVRTTTSGFVVPYAPELRDLATNRVVLAHIAEATGGQLLSDPRAALRPSRAAGAPVDAWPYAAAAAAGLFFAEIAWRRVPVLGTYARILAAGVLTRWRREPSTEDLEAERLYEQADRWALIEEEPAAGSASMEAAARLYIARLKAAKGEQGRPPETGNGKPETGHTEQHRL